MAEQQNGSLEPTITPDNNQEAIQPVEKVENPPVVENVKGVDIKEEAPVEPKLEKETTSTGVVEPKPIQKEKAVSTEQPKGKSKEESLPKIQTPEEIRSSIKGSYLNPAQEKDLPLTYEINQKVGKSPMTSKDSYVSDEFGVRSQVKTQIVDPSYKSPSAADFDDMSDYFLKKLNQRGQYDSFVSSGTIADYINKSVDRVVNKQGFYLTDDDKVLLAKYTLEKKMPEFDFVRKNLDKAIDKSGVVAKKIDEQKKFVSSFSKSRTEISLSLAQESRRIQSDIDSKYASSKEDIDLTAENAKVKISSGVQSVFDQMTRTLFDKRVSEIQGMVDSGQMSYDDAQSLVAQDANGKSKLGEEVVNYVLNSDEFKSSSRNITDSEWKTVSDKAYRLNKNMSEDYNKMVQPYVDDANSKLKTEISSMQSMFGFSSSDAKRLQESMASISKENEEVDYLKSRSLSELSYNPFVGPAIIGSEFVRGVKSASYGFISDMYNVLTGSYVNKIDVASEVDRLKGEGINTSLLFEKDGFSAALNPAVIANQVGSQVPVLAASFVPSFAVGELTLGVARVLNATKFATQVAVGATAGATELSVVLKMQADEAEDTAIREGLSPDQIRIAKEEAVKWVFPMAPLYMAQMGSLLNPALSFLKRGGVELATEFITEHGEGLASNIGIQKASGSYTGFVNSMLRYYTSPEFKETSAAVLWTSALLGTGMEALHSNKKSKIEKATFYKMFSEAGKIVPSAMLEQNLKAGKITQEQYQQGMSKVDAMDRAIKKASAMQLSGDEFTFAAVDKLYDIHNLESELSNTQDSDVAETIQSQIDSAKKELKDITRGSASVYIRLNPNTGPMIMSKEDMIKSFQDPEVVDAAARGDIKFLVTNDNEVSASLKDSVKEYVETMKRNRNEMKTESSPNGTMNLSEAIEYSDLKSKKEFVENRGGSISQEEEARLSELSQKGTLDISYLERRANQVEQVGEASKPFVEKAIAAMSKAFPNMKVTNLASNSKEFIEGTKKALSQRYGSSNVAYNESTRSFDITNQDGTVDSVKLRNISGFNDGNGRIYYNPFNKSSDTIIHEMGGHSWVNNLIGMSKISGVSLPDGSYHTVDEVFNAKDEDLNEEGRLLKEGLNLIKDTDYYSEVKNNPFYAKSSDAQILEEALVQAIGEKGAIKVKNTKVNKDGTLSIDPTVAEKILNWIKKFINKVTGIAPKEGESVEQYINSALKQIFGTEVVSGIGETQAEFDEAIRQASPSGMVDENGDPLNNRQVNFSVRNELIADYAEGIKFVYIKDTEKFERLKQSDPEKGIEPTITEDKTLSDFSGLHMILHTPDNSFTGDIYKDGELLVEGKGGIFYVIKFNNEGFFWASTDLGASGLVRSLNSVRANSKDGKVRMALVSSPPEKLLSSTLNSNAIMDIMFSKALDERVKLSEKDIVRAYSYGIKYAIEEAKKEGKPSSGIPKIKLNEDPKITKDVLRRFFDADNSTFRDRGNINKGMLIGLSNDAEARLSEIGFKKFSSQFLDFFGELTGNEKIKSRGGSISGQNLRDAISNFLSEPLLKGQESGKIYAVIELDSDVKSIDTRGLTDRHESYPSAIVPVDNTKKPVLHILQDRQEWVGNVLDQNGNIVTEKNKLNVLPTNRGVSSLVKVSDNVTKKPQPKFKIESQVNKDAIKPIGKVFTTPHYEADTVANDYVMSNGLPPIAKIFVKTVNADIAGSIADAYDEMEHSPEDPDVIAAYSKMSEETIAQFDHMVKSGYEIEVYTGKGEPYSVAADMIKDLNENKHLYILATENAYGQGEESANLLLSDSGRYDVNGVPLLTNDVFRAVHDFFGHAVMGNSFGPVGEENAWLIHSQMYSPLARRAMTAETRMQNSWVNFNKNMRTVEVEQNSQLLTKDISKTERLAGKEISENEYFRLLKKANELSEKAKSLESSKNIEDSIKRYDLIDQSESIRNDASDRFGAPFQKVVNDSVEIPGLKSITKNESLCRVLSSEHAKKYGGEYMEVDVTNFDGSIVKHAIVVHDKYVYEPQTNSIIKTDAFNKFFKTNIKEKKAITRPAKPGENGYIPLSQRPFSQQKNLLSPEWASDPSVYLKQGPIIGDDIQPKFQIKDKHFPNDKNVNAIRNSPIYGRLTEDDNGNFIFFHVSNNMKLDKLGINPAKFGSNVLKTSQEERMRSVSVSMYYTEVDMSDVSYMSRYFVRIPKNKVYFFNADALDLGKKAKASFDKLMKSKDYALAFDPNQQVGAVLLEARKLGYEMVIAKWGNGMVRAETNMLMMPTKLMDVSAAAIEYKHRERFLNNAKKAKGVKIKNYDMLASERDSKWYKKAIKNLMASQITKDELMDIMQTGKFVIMTPENPANQNYYEFENDNLISDFEETMNNMGLNYIPIVGRYDKYERSFIITDVKPNMAKRLCKMFNQESVAADFGIYYLATNKFNPRSYNNDSFIDGPMSEIDNYMSTVMTTDGPVSFSIGYDFNKEKNLKPKFQIIGVQGARNVGSIMNNYNIAMKMERDGVDVKRIYAATGWFRDFAGDFAYEIDDTNASIISKPTSSETELKNILDYPTLFSAYPSAANIKIQSFVPEDDDGTVGTFNASINNPRIKINESLLTEEKSEELYSTIMHEVQHYIQMIEGFDAGANTDLNSNIQVISYIRDMILHMNESIRSGQVKMPQEEIQRYMDGIDYDLRMLEKFDKIMGSINDEGKEFLLYWYNYGEMVARYSEKKEKKTPKKTPVGVILDDSFFSLSVKRIQNIHDAFIGNNGKVTTGPGMKVNIPAFKVEDDMQRKHIINEKIARGVSMKAAANYYSGVKETDEEREERLQLRDQIMIEIMVAKQAYERAAAEAAVAKSYEERKRDIEEAFRQKDAEERMTRKFERKIRREQIHGAFKWLFEKEKWQDKIANWQGIKQLIFDRIEEYRKNGDLAGKINARTLSTFSKMILNASTEKRLNRALAYLDKALEDKYFGELVGDIRGLKSSIKEMIKGGKNPFGNMYDSAVELIGYDESMLYDPTSPGSFATMELYRDMLQAIANKKMPDFKSYVRDFHLIQDLLEISTDDGFEDQAFNEAKTLSELSKYIDQIEAMPIYDEVDYIAVRRIASSINKRAVELHSQGVITSEEFNDIYTRISKKSRSSDISNFDLRNKVMGLEAFMFASAYHRMNLLDPNQFTGENRKAFVKLRSMLNKGNSIDQFRSAGTDSILLLDKIVTQLENGFMSPKIHMLMNNVEVSVAANEMASDVSNSIKENATKPFKRRFSTSAIEIASKLSGMPKQIVDQALGLGRSKTYYNNVASKLGRAFSALRSSNRELGRIFHQSLKRYGGLMSMPQIERYRVGIVLKQLDYQSNIPNFETSGKVTDVIGYLINNESANITSKELLAIKEAYDSLPKDANGMLDINAALDSLTEREKNLYNTVRNIFDNHLSAKVSESNSRRGEIAGKENNYYRRFAQGVKASEYEEDVTPEQMVAKMSTYKLRSGSTKNRVSDGLYWTVVDPEAVMFRAINEVNTDYYLSQEVPKALGILREAMSKSEGQSKTMISALYQLTKNTLVDELTINRGAADSTGIFSLEGMISLASNRARNLLLSNPFRIVTELLPSLTKYLVSEANISQLNNFLSGKNNMESTLYRKLIMDFHLPFKDNISRYALEGGDAGRQSALSAMADAVSTLSDSLFSKGIFKIKFMESFRDMAGEDFDIERYYSDTRYAERINSLGILEDAVTQGLYGAERLASSLTQFTSPIEIGFTKRSSASSKVFSFMMSYNAFESKTFFENLRDVLSGENEGRIAGLRYMSGVVLSNFMYGALGYFMNQLFQSVDFDDDDPIDEEIMEAMKATYDKKSAGNLLLASLVNLVVGGYGSIAKLGVGFGIGVIDALVKSGYKMDEKTQKLYDEFVDGANEYAHVSGINFSDRYGATTVADATSFIPLFGIYFTPIIDASVNMAAIYDKKSKGQPVTNEEEAGYRFAMAIHALANLSGLQYPGIGLTHKLLKNAANSAAKKSKSAKEYYKKYPGSKSSSSEYSPSLQQLQDMGVEVPTTQEETYKLNEEEKPSNN